VGAEKETATCRPAPGRPSTTGPGRQRTKPLGGRVQTTSEKKKKKASVCRRGHSPAGNDSKKKIRSEEGERDSTIREERQTKPLLRAGLVCRWGKKAEDASRDRRGRLPHQKRNCKKQADLSRNPDRKIRLDIRAGRTSSQRPHLRRRGGGG